MSSETVSETLSKTLSKTTSSEREVEDRLDPRLHAYRGDLAAKKLEGKVKAKRFVAGEPCWAVSGLAPLRAKPDNRAPLDSEVLFGEPLTLYDVKDDWAWVQLERDGYVGYIPAKALSPTVQKPTHRVSAIGTFIYPEANIKTPPLMSLPMNARLTITGGEENFLKLATGGYVFSRHVRELDRPALDFVAVAERFIGVPYLWGGRTRTGVDCSGLVQLALDAAGIAAPRDSDMQQQDLGETVLVPADLEGLQRGDLVFWPDHVGIMLDGVFILHANAHHMAVAVEALRDTDVRISKSGSGLSAIKRLKPADA